MRGFHVFDFVYEVSARNFSFSNVWIFMEIIGRDFVYERDTT